MPRSRFGIRASRNSTPIDIVQQAGEADVGVGGANALAFVSHHLGGDVGQGTVAFRCHLSSAFTAMQQHRLMQPEACIGPIHSTMAPDVTWPGPLGFAAEN